MEAAKGRGSASNPPNRFERIHYAEDADDGGAGAAFANDPSEPPDGRHAGTAREPTRFYRDPTRSAVARNRSPDVGFEASINPYRGCEHGCAYCLAPETRILHADMQWRPIGQVRPGDVLAGFDEFPLPGRTRKLRPAVVEHVWWSRRPTLRLITRQSDIVTTAEHRWLQARNFRWCHTSRLEPGRNLRRLPVVDAEATDDDYRVGYVAGLSLGDGTFRHQPGWRSDAVLHRLLTAEVDTPSYRRGFVAGFFDAEGHNGTSLRLSQVDVDVLERVRRYAAGFGFDFRLERRDGHASCLRLRGSDRERMRFFSVFRPVIARKVETLFGRTPATVPERVEKVEPNEVRDVVDIQTSTGTFYAEGIATHNCYARPTHEYLGWSAGLDFETRILVKERLPELLRRELSSPRWRPQVIALSGNTDAWQPVERRLGITRRCLEVLRDFRNPVAGITKSALVARDADLLAELAEHGAAAVSLSVTTLDRRLARTMEPRASSPAQRLRAIEALAEAGVPVGVMVAPIVPGLNDHEIPAIVAAAASAGASHAGRVLLRLPHGLTGLFDEWLERAAPGRKKKVLNRLRALHDGRLYDARFGARQRGAGRFAEQIDALFELARRRAGLATERAPLSTAAFRRPGGAQLGLFEP